MSDYEIIKTKPDRVKYGGRKKGTPNLKVTLDLLNELKENGFSPAYELMNMFWETDTTKDQKIIIAKELSRYCYPLRKSVEHSGHVNNTAVNLTLKDLKENAQELKDILNGGHACDKNV